MQQTMQHRGITLGQQTDALIQPVAQLGIPVYAQRCQQTIGTGTQRGQLILCAAGASAACTCISEES